MNERDYDADAKRLLNELRGGDQCECEHECIVCKHGKDFASEREREAMAKEGWIVHVVLGDKDAPDGINIHTHGLTTKIPHPDLQIVLPIRPEDAHSVLIDVVKQLEAGKRFPLGRPVGGVLPEGYKLMFVRAHETDREVWRIILPDADGNLLRETLDEQFQSQWEGCEAEDEGKV